MFTAKNFTLDNGGELPELTLAPETGLAGEGAAP